MSQSDFEQMVWAMTTFTTGLLMLLGYGLLVITVFSITLDLKKASVDGNKSILMHNVGLIMFGLLILLLGRTISTYQIASAIVICVLALVWLSYPRKWLFNDSNNTDQVRGSK